MGPFLGRSRNPYFGGSSGIPSEPRLNGPILVGTPNIPFPPFLRGPFWGPEKRSVQENTVFFPKNPFFHESPRRHSLMSNKSGSLFWPKTRILGHFVAPPNKTGLKKGHREHTYSAHVVILRHRCASLYGRRRGGSICMHPLIYVSICTITCTTNMH